ncbi:MAG: hypothetical protein ACYTG7_24810, partial [Planctomycetota bacterium]
MGFALLFLMLTAGPVFAMGTVWIVDDSGGPGVDFTTIQDGINGAADHDVLLVHGGYYSGGWATIDGKSLTICSAATATVILDGLYFRVKNLASDQTVILRGFQSSQFHPVSETAMEFMDNVGMIWVEDCDLFGGIYAGTVPLVRIMSSDRVIFQHTDLNGLYTGLTFEDPVSGLEAWDSSVYLHDCVVWGGTGVGFHGFYMT